MATIVDVAKAAGVSIATVSAILNGKGGVSAKLEARVRMAIEDVGYQPNAIARSLKRGRTHSIGLMVADITNPFFTAVVQAVHEVAYVNDYAVMLCSSDEDSARERMHLRLLSERMVDGLVVAPVATDGECAELLRRARVPVILLDRLVPGLTADAIVVDNAAATREAIRYLIGLGHRRIGFIGGPEGLSSAAQRLDGYRRALEEAGLAVDAGLVGDGRFRQVGGYAAAMQLLATAERPTAIFAANNQMTIGLMLALKDLGLSCPADLSVACFDDFDWASAFHPRLTTVAQPTTAIGVQAVTLLLERIAAGGAAEPRVVTLRAELKVRDSCRPPRTLVVA